MYYLYIMYSPKLDRYYSGQSKNANKRFLKHNKGHSLATKGGVPWQLMKIVEFETRAEVIKAENWLKSMKSRQITERVIAGDIDVTKVVG